jgi:hypothetical protein
VRCYDPAKTMLLVPIIILFNLDILVYVHLSSMVINVKRIIDYVNQILVGIMVLHLSIS